MAKASLENGSVAQVGKRLVCNQEVSGSIPLGSTAVTHHNICSYALCSRAHPSLGVHVCLHVWPRNEARDRAGGCLFLRLASAAGH